MAHENNSIIQQVSTYYSGKVAEHGATPKGVDWNGEEGQVKRFEQLLKIVPDPTQPFSLNDLGCGYGALADYMNGRFDDFAYCGQDISAEMLAAAAKAHAGKSNVSFEHGSAPSQIADYCVASGIFNVRFERGDAEWLDYFHETLDAMNRTSRKGFAFNCLTSYSDAEYMRKDLYYADPCALFDRCKRLYSRQVALLHDYGLYEFTILVRKDA